MASYKVEIAKSVERDLKNIDNQFVSKVFSSMKLLSENPYPKNKYKKLKGSESCYRLRIGNYRILYEINESNRIINVYKVRHRKDVYKY
jgi:mRNA interferase RelE/StbE